MGRSIVENLIRVVGTTLIVLIAIGCWHIMPTINPNSSHHQVFINSPDTQPTGVPYVPKRVNKEKLIIMQNPDCWIGIPGATCGSEKTYVQ